MPGFKSTSPATDGTPALNNLNWSAVALGALAGVASAMVVFLVFGITGIVDSRDDEIALLFLQFLGLVAGGYVAGRLGSRDHVLHGGVAGLAMFLVTTVITLAAAPDSSNIVVIAFTGLVAATLGSAGGAIARATKPPSH